VAHVWRLAWPDEDSRQSSSLKEVQSYLGHNPIRKVAPPAVLDFLNLAVGPDVDLDHAVYGLLLLDALDRVLVRELQLDRIARAGHFMLLDLDGFK